MTPPAVKDPLWGLLHGITASSPTLPISRRLLFTEGKKTKNPLIPRTQLFSPAKMTCAPKINPLYWLSHRANSDTPLTQEETRSHGRGLACRPNSALSRRSEAILLAIFCQSPTEQSRSSPGCRSRRVSRIPPAGQGCGRPLRAGAAVETLG